MSERQRLTGKYRTNGDHSNFLWLRKGDTGIYFYLASTRAASLQLWCVCLRRNDVVGECWVLCSDIGGVIQPFLDDILFPPMLTNSKRHPEGETSTEALAVTQTSGGKSRRSPIRRGYLGHAPPRDPLNNAPPRGPRPPPPPSTFPQHPPPEGVAPLRRLTPRIVAHGGTEISPSRGTLLVQPSKRSVIDPSPSRGKCQISSRV